jgi:phage baseplate assembly protein W
VPNFKPFKDLSITFKPHPITGDLIVTKDKAAIKQSIVNLLLTVKGERPFNSELGSSLNRLLFEPLDFAIGSLIDSEIRAVLTKYEPRIAVRNVVVGLNFENNGFDVELEFEIIGREDVLPQTINFFLERNQ